MKNLIYLTVILFVYQGLAQEKPVKKTKFTELASIVSDLKVSDFHKYHVREFAKADGFAMKRTISMPKIIHLVVENKKYRLKNMRLLSVTDRKKPVLWELPSVNNDLGWIGDGIDRSMLKNKNMKKRPLTEKELMSMNSLRQGKEERVLSKKEGAVQLMAPLHAGPSCIRCHEDYKKGEFMGAFLYDLKSVEGGLNKKEKAAEPDNKNEVEKLLKEISLKEK